jgi:hypothetical protein
MHLIILLLAWRFPTKLQMFHGAVVILSYMLFAFNVQTAFN